MEIPKGMFVFTSDSREVGEVTTTGSDEFTVQLRDVDAAVTLPRSAAGTVSTGKLHLELDASTLYEDYIKHIGPNAREWDPHPAASRERVPTAEHVSREDADILWDELPERSWKALHELAHRMQGGDRIEGPVLADVVKVARGLEHQGAPFPASAGDLGTELNKHAETMAHESTANP